MALRKGDVVPKNLSRSIDERSLTDAFLMTKPASKSSKLAFLRIFAPKSGTHRRIALHENLMSVSSSSSPIQEFAALGEQPVGKLLMQYAFPAIIAMIASSLYNLVDGIFIGQGVGEAAITGLALTNPLMAITAAFGAMVGVGGATLMSVRLGQQDYQVARSILGNVVLLNIVMGIVLGAVLLLFLDPILRSFGASEATLPYAYNYMSIILYGNVVTHLYLGLNAQLRSTNRPRLAMYATFGTVVLNAGLDALFIFGFQWGISGAAWATVLAQVMMLLWQITLFTKRGNAIRLTREVLCPRWRLMRECMWTGLPQFLINACASLVSIILTRSMAEYGGDTAVGAYGITNRLLMLVVFIVIGLNQGMQPIAGFNYGAQKFDRLLTTLRYTILAASLVTTTGFAVFMLAAEPCVAIFAKDAPLLVRNAASGLRITVLFFPIVGMQIVSSAFFQSIGQPGKSIFLSLTRQMIFLIPALLLLPHWITPSVLGVWYALPAADAAAALFSLVLLVQQIRRLRQYRGSSVQV